MRYHALIPLAAAVANLILCVPVLRHGGRNPEHRKFAFLTLTIAAWNLDVFALYFFTDPVRAEWWSRVLRSGMCIAPAALLDAALVTSDTRGPRWRAAVGVAYVVGGLLAVANMGGLLVRRVTPHVWGWYIEPTPLYGLLTTLILVCLVLSIQRQWHTYRHSASPRRRTQAKFWLVGGGIQAVFVSTNFLPIYGINIYPLGNFGNVLWTSLISYAIVRHRMMDLDYVVRRSISFLIATATVLVPGGLLLSAFARQLGTGAPSVLVCASVALAIVAVILVPALQEALETRLHRVLFRQRYDRRVRLRQLAASLVHILTEEELIARLGDELRDILNVDKCEIFVRDEDSPRLRGAYPSEQVLAEEDASQMEGLRDSVLRSEVEALGLPIALLFATRGWEVVVALRMSDRLTGFIAVGPDRDFRMMSGEDLGLLETVAASATVALENARLSLQLRRSEVVLERANRLSSLGVLAAGIAHEIRNPLVAVKTFLDLLPTRLDDPDFITQFRSLSLTELRRVTDLITDMLTLGKSSNAERRLVDPGQVINPVVRLMDSMARKRGAEFEVHIERDLPQVWADPDQLKQIVLNLVLNAIEVSPTGGHIKVGAHTGWQPQGRRVVVIEVTDEGNGIPQEQLETIFHPFFTTKESGTGLGLALVHQMVLEHGGETSVDSQVGRGTTFRVTLPAADTEFRKTGS